MFSKLIMQHTKPNGTDNGYYWLSSTPCLEVVFTKSTKITYGNDGCLCVPDFTVSSKENYKTTLNTYVMAVCHPAGRKSHQIFKIKRMLVDGSCGRLRLSLYTISWTIFDRNPAGQLLSSDVTPLLCADMLLQIY